MIGEHRRCTSRSRAAQREGSAAIAASRGPGGSLWAPWESQGDPWATLGPDMSDYLDMSGSYPGMSISGN